MSVSGQLRRILATVIAHSQRLDLPVLVGVHLAVDEICERMKLEPPTEDEIGVCLLASEMDAALMELVEKGEYEICGQTDIGNNLYRKLAGAGPCAAGEPQR